MKKRLLAAVLLLVAMLAACSSGPEYNVKVKNEIYFQQNEASPIEIKVTEDGKATRGLDVSANLTMANMDHGTTKVKFDETADAGTYIGEAKLPMSGKYEAVITLEKDGKKSEKVINFNVLKAQGVAKMNGEWITDEDVAFYKLINQLQLEMNREAAKKNYTGAQLEEQLAYLKSQEKIAEDKNNLLTQIIRLRSMAMLAKEKGHKAEPAEVEEAVSKARNQYNRYESAKALISEYDEDKFWATERQQYEMIVLSQKVQSDLVTKVKQENPSYGEQEVLFQAQKQYEELLVSQVNSLKIEIL
ncbi:FixH family protein [Bacillus sp. FJAT-29814]|uniref:FixH family protein n=1 Tax=Bacillus sp. FJAT-29814 TaxID=1729688 RepID=UPI00082F627F|nr:FixH family protein [Bacillus sp. FJAT-29814]